MAKKFVLAKRILIALLSALLVVCTISAISSFNKRSAFAAEYSYQEGRDGFSYSTDGLAVTFTTADVEDGLSNGFIKWGVYLIDENTGITYNTTTHKYTDDTSRQRYDAAYYFLLDGSASGDTTYNLTVPADAIAYHATSNPSSASDYGTNTGKTLADVFEEKDWIVGVGPMFANWWASGYGAPIDYYVGRANEVVGAKVYYYDYNGTEISNVSYTVANLDNNLVAPSAPDHSPWTFNGWYCDTNKQVYSSAQVNELTYNGVKGTTRVVNFYATYDKHLSEYIEFTSIVNGEDDIEDNDATVLTKIIDATSESDYEFTVVYNITHNDGVNSILLIPEFDKNAFTLTNMVVKSDTVLGNPTPGLDGENRIVLENTDKYSALDSSFLVLTFTVNVDKVQSGDYYFGLKMYPVAENDSSVAYFIEDGLTKGDQTEVEIRMVYGNKLNVILKLDAQIEIGTTEDESIYSFIYNKESVTVTKVEALPDYTNDNLEVFYTYDGDATVVIEWFNVNGYDQKDGEALVGAPMLPGHYLVEMSAPETDRYYAVDTVSRLVYIAPASITISIDDKSSDYGDAIVELTYTIEGVITGDTATVTLSTTATSSSNVGTYDITAAEYTTNVPYDVTVENGTYTINPKEITITAENQQASYTGEEPEVDQTAYTVTGVDSVNGVVITKEAGVNVGTYTLTPSYVNTNYTITLVNGTFTITSVGKNADYIKSFFSGDTVTYDEDSHDLLIVSSEIPAWISSAYSVSNNIQTNANSYTITITVNFNAQTAANYTNGVQEFVSSVTGVINPYAITITADDKTVVYGSAPVTCTPITVNGVDEDVINVTYTVENNGVAFVPAKTTSVGVYDIIPHATDSNYAFTFVNGTYTVTKAEISDNDDDDLIDDASDDNITLPGLKISVSAEDVYYNRALVNSYKVMVGEVVLTKDVDYTVKFYSDADCTNEVTPENAGTYYIKVEVAGNGNYVAASKVDSFVINKIQLSAPEITYNGATFTIGAVTTDVGELALKEGTVVSYLVDGVANNGTYTSTTTGTHTYTAVSSNANYLPYEGTTVTCYAISFTEGSHEYNPTVLDVPATMYCFDTSSIVLPAALTLDGYTFVSWDGNEAESEYAPEEDVELAAIWNALTYDITFKYLADGQVQKTLVLHYGDLIVYFTSEVAPVKDSDNAGIYYTFAHAWTYNAADYEIEVEEGEATLQGITVSGDMEFVAVFDTNYNSFTLTYYLYSIDDEIYTVWDTQEIVYLQAIEYAAISEQVQWFKVDAWYRNTARTEDNLLTVMPNEDIAVYGAYVFDIGAGDVNGSGVVNADDITLYRQWIVGGYTMQVVEVGTEWTVAQDYDSTVRYFLKRVSDINYDNSKDIRDVSITRMSLVQGYNWDILNGVSVTGNEIVRTYQTQSINDVYNNLSTGKRVILANDITNLEGILEVNYNGNIYIDLNGYTFTLDHFTLSSNGKNATVTVKNGTIVTTNGIQITAPNGNVILEDLIGYDSNGLVNLQAASNSLHLQGNVKFYVYEDAEYLEDAVPAAVNVEEGTHVVVEEQAVVVIEKIVVTENFVPSETAEITLNNNSTVTEEIVVEGNCIKEICTLEKLVEAATNGGEYVLGADFSYSGQLTVKQDLVLDLNGHTLQSVNNVAISAVDGASLTINGNGNVIAQEACVMAFSGSTVIINGGTYTAIDNFVIGTNGSNGKGNNTITINGGVFNGTIVSAGYVACGIYVANSDTVVVNGGVFNITNGVGILARSGNTTIGEDVVFNVSGNGTLGKVGDSKVTVPSGSAIVWDKIANYPGGEPTVVNNGTYEVVALIESVAEMVAVRNKAGVIVLYSDLIYNGQLSFTKDTVIELNNHTIQSVNNTALSASNGATLTINGEGNVMAQEACVMAFNGSAIVINGGTYTAIDNFVFGTNGTSGQGANTITVNEGVFNGGIVTAGYVACGIYVANNDVVTVNGGEFNITNGVGILARSGNTTVGADVVFNVSGNGTLGKVGDSLVTVPAGEVLVIDTVANYPGGAPVLVNNSSYNAVKVIKVDNVVTVASIVTKVSQLNNVSGYVILGKDIAFGGQIAISEDTVIDLNGYTLRSTNNVAISVVDGASLTINGNGNVIAQEACVMAFNGSTIVINGGTYTAIDNFVIGTNGSNGKGNNTITINGGVFNGGIVTAGYVACGIYVANSDTVTVNGGEFNITNGVGILARSGNTTVGADVVFNVSGNGATGKVGDSKVTVPSGAVIVYDLAADYPGGDPVIVNNTEYDVTAVVGSVADIDAVRGWVKAIVLGKDIVNPDDDYIIFRKDMVLDLNGHSITDTDSVAIYVASGASLTINGNGSVTAQEACVMAIGGSTVVINGGTYTAVDNFVIGTNGSSGYGANTIIINSGVFNGGIVTAGYVACGIYVANSDTVVVNGGTFNITNGVGVLARSGNTTIGENAVFNVTGNGTEGKVGDSRVVVPSGAVLVLDTLANYPGGDPVINNNSSYTIEVVE